MSGLHILPNGQPRLLEVDTIIICAGQDPARELYDSLAAMNPPAELIGSAYAAAELDGKAAIKQASYLAAAASLARSKPPCHKYVRFLQ